MSILLSFLPVLVELFGPNPPIVVSEQTTVITFPLAADGLPNYQQYWRDYGREGVTHENNAAVPFWKAIWPGELQHRHWVPMSQALGFDQVPSPTHSIRDPFSSAGREALGFWLTQHYQEGLSPTDADLLLSPENQKLITVQAANEVVSRAMRGAWTSEQIPPLASWLVNNEEAFKLLHKAASRPKWWSPSPSLLDEPYKGAIYMLLPGVQSLRGAARGLSLRAMWNLGEDRPEDAWKDLQASFQLARLCGKGVTLIEQLVAIAIDQITCQRVAALLHHSEPNAAFARKVLQELSSLDVPSNVARAIDQGERIFFADLVVTWIRDEINLVDVGIDNSAPVRFEYLNYIRIDWNHVLRQGTSWYDRLRESLHKPTRADRINSLTQNRKDLERLAEDVRKPERLLVALLSCDERSQLVADILVTLMVSALDASTKAEDRARVWLDLTRTAAALAVYRAENGEYPVSLEQLSPDIIPRVPTDLYTGEPFIYERKVDGGYLLYSLYENGIDDGGTDLSGEVISGEWYMGIQAAIPSSSADLVIRMPTPEFELPPRPSFSK